MKKPIQPYESHMQYLAQWMCDYNLYGCAYIDCCHAKFRSPIPEYLELENENHKWHDRTIDPSDILDEDLYPMQSHCSIEVDVRVADIMNRNDIKHRPIHNDFVELSKPLPEGEKLVQSMAGLWRDETLRRKARMGIKDPSSTPFPAEVLVSVSADPRNTQAGGWIHEEDFRTKIIDIIRDEKMRSDGAKIDFNSFIGQIPFEKGVKTALESVEDLFEENVLQAAEVKRLTQRMRDDSHYASLDAPQVDESRLLSYMAEEANVGSDEEMPGGHETLNFSEDHHQLSPPNQAVHGSSLVDLSHNAKHTLVPAEQVAAQPEPSQEKRKKKRTSADVVALGVYHIRSPLHHQRDLFELGEDFSGDLKADRKALNETDEGPQRKKRKVFNSKFEDASSIEGLIDAQIFQLHPDPHDVSIVSGDTTSSSSPPRRRVQQNKQESHESRAFVGSQGSSKTLPNNRIPFPVTKNCQNPAMIRELSQTKYAHSSGPQASKQQSLSVNSPNDTKLSSVPTFVPQNEPCVSLSKPSPQAIRMCSQVRTAFDICSQTSLLCLSHTPISCSDADFDLRSSPHPTMIHQDAFYSREHDVPERTREYGGKEFKLQSDSISYLPPFNAGGTSVASNGNKSGTAIDKVSEASAFSYKRLACNLRTWEFRDTPPSHLDVQQWLDSEAMTNDSQACLLDLPVKADVSQIDYSTQKNKHGIKYSQAQKSTSVMHETQYMSIMSLEVHVNTQGSFVPNPEQNEVCAIFWCLRGDGSKSKVPSDDFHTGIIVLSDDGTLTHQVGQQASVEVEGESSELDLLNHVVDTVRFWDPDILTGYEVHGSSWGYLIERARCKYDFNLCDEFSRVKSDSHGRFGKEEDRWGFNHTSTIRVTGRHMINIWRAMRGELNLLQYTMENVVFQLCHRRIPHYSHLDLTKWYCSGKIRDLAKVLEYYISRVKLDIEILDQNELVPRTSEQARLLGVDFFSVFSRGSQFKVESLMFRIAKPENLLLPSPSRKQVGQQNALECLPLVMEPQSSFFSSPLLVLDFQSLYPSVMIAYNYCYSTCLGRVVNWMGQNKMGFTDYHRQPRMLELLQDHINIAPNGIIYTKPLVRKSLLAKMLSEILETRVMVKSGMKVDKDDKTLQRLLNNRQLALKLIANVTYGYTSASFSGRMPCSEIADSIVQTGRETLEKAIALIHSVQRWGAEVVYGDTDSLFVHLKGRTKDEAFDIGHEIAKTITDMNPRPVKLKFEKVYFPCVLLAKKRYVGFKYESKQQTQPDFDAKGIETVRRDGTPAAQKIEERALKLLFTSADLSQVKQYFQHQCGKIMRGRISIQDFCFAKEVKLGTYSDKGPPPPGALISTKRMLEDPRAEPQYGERVPYVVVAGGPGARLIDRCVAPEVALHDVNTELDSEYYISKHLIPPLERIFNLVGANVRQWYDEMPKYQRMRRVDTSTLMQGNDKGALRKTLESYMKSSSCLICHEKLEEEAGICDKCSTSSDKSLFKVQSRLRREEWKKTKLERICRSCSNLAWGEDVQCDSKDCPVYYTRIRQQSRLKNTVAMALSVKQRLEEFSLTKGLDW